MFIGKFVSLSLGASCLYPARLPCYDNLTIILSSSTRNAYMYSTYPWSPLLSWCTTPLNDALNLLHDEVLALGDATLPYYMKLQSPSILLFSFDCSIFLRTIYYLISCLFVCYSFCELSVLLLWHIIASVIHLEYFVVFTSVILISVHFKTSLDSLSQCCSPCFSPILNLAIGFMSKSQVLLESQVITLKIPYH